MCMAHRQACACRITDNSLTATLHTVLLEPVPLIGEESDPTSSSFFLLPVTKAIEGGVRVVVDAIAVMVRAAVREFRILKLRQALESIRMHPFTLSSSR